MATSIPCDQPDMGDEEQTVPSLSAKEIKKLAKPEFAANPDKFYPTETLRKLGFHRATCSCGTNYWRYSEKRVTCGDSQCEKRYHFIGVGTGIGRGPNAKKLSYADAWNGFKRSLTTARVPCTAIPRYPVVARWRADVDYVAAGIFCFQPYCVTGELAPPANPLICPQFCLRFNDLDNIGYTGRHYSGFVMLGIQVFNAPNDYHFWMNECVEFNYRWLTEELMIDPEEITFIEDVWAGGGNLGPSIEYFVGGLELGNMVFMQYKTFPDGSREPLQVQVIDVGIGLERVPWLINGSPTSYVDVFPTALEFAQKKLNIDINEGIWKGFGPLSCLLNVDEVDDVNVIWNQIGKELGLEGSAVKAAIEPVRDLYTILDHSRTVLMAVYDGSLPSNVGGAANVRNILRRVFAILKQRGWDKHIGIKELLTLFECHKLDLAKLYGEFAPYKSFAPIIELEFERWLATDKEQKEKVDKLLKKKKGKLELNDWMVAVQSYGMPAETISALSGLPIPGNLHYAIAEQQERSVRAIPTVLYSTAHLPPTNSLYYADHHKYAFKAKILQVMLNVTRQNSPSIIVLDQSSFYPTSGGQEHDTGSMTIDGAVYQVVDVMKVGPAVLHVLEPSLPISATNTLESYVGKEIDGLVDEERRSQLRNNHTATHIVYASCRRVLGPHVWQNGAKKTTKQAHLDITHYQSLTYKQQLAIQTEANRIIQSGKPITKGFMPKDEAEKKYGFHLYQGGVVPGNELRVVSIADTDTEACCGTHSDNTSEVGLIKIIKTARISDGIVRLYYVAGELALDLLNQESSLINALEAEWGIGQDDILATASRFFEGYKKLNVQVTKQSQTILDLQMRCLILDPNVKLAVYRSAEPTSTLYISNMPQFASELKATGKSVVFVGDGFLYALLGDAAALPSAELTDSLNSLAEAAARSKAQRNEEKSKSEHDTVADLKVQSAAATKAMQVKVMDSLTVSKGKDKKTGKKVSEKLTGIAQIVVFSMAARPETVIEWLTTKGFVAKMEE